jgi:hypothetical protein
MSEKNEGRAGRKQGKSAGDREIRLAKALRANLLKRKAQARARTSAKPSDEGGTERVLGSKLMVCRGALREVSPAKRRGLDRARKGAGRARE